MYNENLIRTKVKQNSQVLDVLSTENLIAAWEKTTGKEIAQLLVETARTTADYTSATLDTATATAIINDLGAKGKVALKTVNWKTVCYFQRERWQSFNFHGNALSCESSQNC